MRTLVAAFLALCLLASPVVAFKDPLSLREAADRLIGDSSMIELVEEESSRPNAYYAPAGDYCDMYGCFEMVKAVLVLRGLQHWPEEAQLAILAHELVHHLQVIHGWPISEPQADLMAANLMCTVFGVDGRKTEALIAQLFLDIYPGLSWDTPDAEHGSLRERVQWVQAAKDCATIFDSIQGE